MNKKLRLSLSLELVWWIATFIIVIAVLYPILSSISNYPFLLINVVFVTIFITLTRHIFFLKHTFIAQIQPLKVALFFLCIPLLFYLINQLTSFQSFMDEVGLDSFLKEVEYNHRIGLRKYIRNEMIFFGVGAIIASAIFSIRLLISVWLLKNRGRV